jgi:hypothetical protein
MFPMSAYLHPKPKPSHRAWYAYDVTFMGEIIITDSRDPEHDLARVLVARGVTGTVVLNDGNKPRTIINVTKAAQWCVGSNLHRKKVGESGIYSSLAGEAA